MIKHFHAKIYLNLKLDTDRKIIFFTSQLKSKHFYYFVLIIWLNLLESILLQFIHTYSSNYSPTSFKKSSRELWNGSNLKVFISFFLFSFISLKIMTYPIEQYSWYQDDKEDERWGWFLPQFFDYFLFHNYHYEPTTYTFFLSFFSLWSNVRRAYCVHITHYYYYLRVSDFFVWTEDCLSEWVRSFCLG